MSTSDSYIKILQSSVCCHISYIDAISQVYKLRCGKEVERTE